MAKKQTPLNKFLKELSSIEGKLSEVKIGDLREVIRVINLMQKGALYKWVKKKYK